MLLAPHVRNSPSRALCHALDRYRKSNVCLHDDKICFGILIHAPRMGRDDDVAEVNPILRISIHAPRMGRDATIQRWKPSMIVFQSTRPAWGATVYLLHYRVLVVISIHAPHMGRDAALGLSAVADAHFNPRAPYGARLPTAVAARSAPSHAFTSFPPA